MTVKLRSLLPNKGREAAVYMHHIVQHYEALPEGLALVHDHGPAARHSLCGPFFRRLRAYYGGIRENLRVRRERAAAAAAAAGNATARGRGGRRSVLELNTFYYGRRRQVNRTAEAGEETRDLLLRFAGQVVSLSSGCSENWLKGCCATLVCAEDGVEASAAKPNYLGEEPGVVGPRRRRRQGGGGGGMLGADAGAGGGATGGLADRLTGSGGQRTAVGGGIGLQSGQVRLGVGSGGLAGTDAKGAAGAAGGARANATAVAARLALLKSADPSKYKQMMGRILNALDGSSWGEEREQVEQEQEGPAGARQAWEAGASLGFGISAGGPGRGLLQAGAAEGAGAVAGGARGRGFGAVTTGAVPYGMRNPFRDQAGPRDRCPFRTSKCLAPDPDYHGRHVYLHGSGGLYDTRYENLLVLHGAGPEAATAAAMAGHTNAGFGPLSLARYGSGSAVETVRAASSASRMADYPPGSSGRSPGQTFAALRRILQTHAFAEKKTPGGFKSCCASMLVRPHHIRRWPAAFYRELRAYTLDTNNTYHATLAVSHHGWALWAPAATTPADLMRYFRVDVLQPSIRGCPAWRMLDAGAAAG